MAYKIAKQPQALDIRAEDTPENLLRTLRRCLGGTTDLSATQEILDTSTQSRTRPKRCMRSRTCLKDTHTVHPGSTHHPRRFSANLKGRLFLKRLPWTCQRVRSPDAVYNSNRTTTNKQSLKSAQHTCPLNSRSRNSKACQSPDYTRLPSYRTRHPQPSRSKTIHT